MSNVLFRSGMMTVLFLACLMAFGEWGLWLGASPSALTFVMATLAAVIMTHVFSSRGRRDSQSWRTTVLAFALAVVVFVLACLLAGLFHDTTVDGNAYHKLAVAALQDGWNPLREPVTEWDRYAEVYTFETRAPLWVEHYAQGLWIASAAVYDVVGSIEAAKCYTLLGMFSFAALSQWYLLKKGLRSWQAACVSVLGAVNPITLAQFGTYYCDAFLMMGLFILITGLIMLADEDMTQDRAALLPIIAAAFVLCANTKFTGLAYAGLFSVAFCLLYLYRWRKRAKGFTGRSTFKLACFFLGIVVFSVVAVGFSSYCTNFIDHGNPLYPLLGEGKVDIMTPQEPDSFHDASTLKKLFLSYFSQTSNPTPGTGEPVLKVPFTVWPEELTWLSAVDLRIGGFGVLYSGIVVLSVVLYAVMLVWSRKNARLLFESGIAFAVPLVGLAFGLSDSWWARYSAYAYGINLFVLSFLFIAGHRAKDGRATRLARPLGGLMTVLLAANTALFVVYGVMPNYEASARMTECETALKEAVLTQGATLYVSYDSMPGEVYCLDDAGIPYVNESAAEAGTYEEGDTLGFVRYRLEYPEAANKASGQE